MRLGYDSTTGLYIGVFAPAGGVNTAILDNIRGISLRANGNLLVTNGDGVHEITRSNTLVETKISGVSARFIEYTLEPVPVELQAFEVE